MGAKIYLDQHILVDEKDLSGDVLAMTLGLDSEEKDTTVVNQNHRSFESGSKMLQCTFNGFWENRDRQLDEYLFESFTNATPSVVSLFPDGREKGDAVYSFTSSLTKYMVDASVTEFVKFTGEASRRDDPSKGVRRGKVVYVNEALAADHVETLLVRGLEAQLPNQIISVFAHVFEISGEITGIDVRYADGPGLTGRVWDDALTSITAPGGYTNALENPPALIAAGNPKEYFGVNIQVAAGTTANILVGVSLSAPIND